jgi:mono/diheme cytochrome c family protein
MNKKQTLIISIFLLIAAMLVTACSAQVEATNVQNTQSQDANADDHAEDDDHGDEEEDQVDGGEHDDDMDMAHAHVDPPADFADLTNPVTADHEAIEAGEVTYNNLCASCHGNTGEGDGPASTALDPKPAALSDGMMMNGLSDGYLFWRVSKGGAMEPFNSAMPAWEGALTEEQRWQVISYVRTFAGGEGEQMEDSHEEADDHEN